MDASADRGERRERRRPHRPVENLTQSLLPSSADCWSCSANSFFLRFFIFFLFFKSRLKSVQTAWSAPVFWNRRDVSSAVFSLMTLKQTVAGSVETNQEAAAVCFLLFSCFMSVVSIQLQHFVMSLMSALGFFSTVLFVVSISRRDFHIVT